MIEAAGLTKRYGATVAVQDLSFTIAPPGDRVPRAERCREIHHDAADPGPGRPGCRVGDGGRPAVRVVPMNVGDAIYTIRPEAHMLAPWAGFSVFCLSRWLRLPPGSS